MDLPTIISRIKLGLEHIDEFTTIQNSNRRNRNNIYSIGLKSLFEEQVCRELVSWWKIEYPNDFNENKSIQVEVHYPENNSQNCDVVFSSNSFLDDCYEWAIELKYIQLVGDNGKNNDHTIQKVLSPYLKDRSLFHDATRLSKSRIARYKAVIGFGFEYSFESLDDNILHHPNDIDRIKNINTVCRNTDPINGVYGLAPLIKIVERHLKGENLIEYDHGACTECFLARRHPCGGFGKIFGWQINDCL